MVNGLLFIELLKRRIRIGLIVYVVLSTTAASVNAQSITITGIVLDDTNQREIEGVQLYLKGNQHGVFTSSKGAFELTSECLLECVLVLNKTGYKELRLPLEIRDGSIELGFIGLSRENPVEKREVLLNLSESDLNEDDGVSDVVGLLQGSRDIFLNRAAFDFSQSFFRVRGYDSSEGSVHINGLPMNNLNNGRPQWNNWGGLNDIMRYATRSLNLDVSRSSFEGLMGGVDFKIRPSHMRPGIRLTTSFANRSYTNRLMATYASGKRDGKFAYACSVSRRWAEEGYIQGTPYNAYSFFGSIEFELNKYSSIYAMGMWAHNQRGRSAPITNEVFDLRGSTYNPYWGKQGNRIRNARERTISEPILMLNYHLTRERFRLRLGLGYQFGEIASSRLGYFQAPNPDPTYYRYLPSFYFNNNFGNYDINAQNAAYGFRSGGQLSWEEMYRANSNSPTGKASYIDYSEVLQGRQITAGANGNLSLGNRINLDAGISYRKLDSENFARIDDLLDAAFHLDIDPFSNTENDINGTQEKVEGDRFSYAYSLGIRAVNAYLQLEMKQRRWSAFFSSGLESRIYQRRGLFLNARFPEESFGDGAKLEFSGIGFKSGIGYSPNSRVKFNLLYTQRPRLPIPSSLYINPRDNHNSISYEQLPESSSIELNTLIRLPQLTGRISGYSTWFQNTTEIGYYYTDSGLGSDFVQEVLSNINTRHQGLEFGLEYTPSSSVTLSIAGTLARYQYVNNPSTTLYFDVTSKDLDPIHPSGKADLGPAQLEGLYISRGPQRAVSFGITYRDPDFWFVSATMNEISRNFIALSVLPRTASFYTDPDTKQSYNDVDIDFVERQLIQNPLPSVHLLNLVGGKSWLIEGHYLGIFASVNNLFNTTYRTGGFEQSRNGHYGQFVKDERSLSPSFAPKYWYGYGRTYFLNISLSL